MRGCRGGRGRGRAGGGRDDEGGRRGGMKRGRDGRGSMGAGGRVGGEAERGGGVVISCMAVVVSP